MSSLRWRPSQMSKEARLSLRAGFCLATPLLMGAISGHRWYATLVAVGALWGISQDGSDRWRVRGSRLLSVAFMSGFGIMAGSLFVNEIAATWALVVFFGLVTLVAGIIEASRWSAQGMYLLLGVIVGAGLGFVGRSWESGLSVMLGCLWVYLVASLTDRRSRVADQRDCLAHAYESLSLSIAVTEQQRVAPRRAQTIRTLDVAQDVIGTERVRRSDAETTALRQCLIVALQFGEISTLSTLEKPWVHVSLPPALKRIGSLLRNGSAIQAIELIAHYEEEFTAQATTLIDHRVANAFQFPSPTSIEDSPPFRSTIAPLPWSDRIRFAVIFSIAVTVATYVAQQMHGPQSYWLPLAVAFIFRPDLGPVVRRALARTVGTLAGVAIAWLVTTSGNNLWLLIALCWAMAAAVPWAAERSHALTVMFFTPIVFVFIEIIGNNQELFIPRMVDTAIGAAIVLGIDLVLWSRAPSLRPAQQVAQARAATLDYESTTGASDPVTRHSLRRRALRTANQARNSLELARVDPHPFRHLDLSLTEQINALEAQIHHHTIDLILGEPTVT